MRGDGLFQRGQARADQAGADQVELVGRGADRALDAPQRVPPDQLVQPFVAEQQLLGGGGEALAERGGLGRHVVGAADQDRLVVLHGARGEPGQHGGGPLPDQPQRVADLYLLHVLGQVARGHPLVDVLVPGQRVELLDPRLDVVPGDPLAGGDARQVDVVEDPLVGVEHPRLRRPLGPQHRQPQAPLRPYLLLG